MQKVKYYIVQIRILLRGSYFILTHPANKGKFVGTLIKMIYWKVNKHFIKKDLITEISKGVKCICPYWSSYGGIVFMTGKPEYWESELFLKVIKKDSVVIIVGANIGFYSLLAASKATDGFVYSFDVDPRITNVIRRNIKINGFSGRIKYYRKLVSDKNGMEQFVNERESEMSHIAYPKDFQKTQKYPSISLDSFVKRLKIKKINIVKIDVEGAEYKVLHGMKNLISEKRIDYLLIEINENIHLFGFTHSDIFNILKNSGYKIYIFRDGGLEKLKSDKIQKRDINKNLLAVNPKIKNQLM